MYYYFMILTETKKKDEEWLKYKRKRMIKRTCNMIMKSEKKIVFSFDKQSSVFFLYKYLHFVNQIIFDKRRAMNYWTKNQTKNCRNQKNS